LVENLEGHPREPITKVVVLKVCEGQRIGVRPCVSIMYEYDGGRLRKQDFESLQYGCRIIV
jgi:hypothetical protein